MHTTLAICSAPRPEGDPYGEGYVLAEKYRLLREIGRGGMGTVWEALNTTIGLPVGIKLSSARKDGALVKARLLREAQVASMLSHPAVVRVYDYGESRFDDPFLVMELLGGETLGAMLLHKENKRLPPKLAVQVLLPIASGVHAANVRGIIHRDLKPDNIMITSDDAGLIRPKIVDFGVAMIRWLDAEGSFESGAVVGTPEYMAPEQALALEEIDHRADVWGFCAMLYETISGVTPFGRPGFVEALVAVVGLPVPSLHTVFGIDEMLWAIIDRGLQKDPNDRWPNMRELGEALANWLLDMGVEEDASGTSLRVHWGSETLRSPRRSGVATHEIAIPLVRHHEDPEITYELESPSPRRAG